MNLFPSKKQGPSHEHATRISWEKRKSYDAPTIYYENENVALCWQNVAKIATKLLQMYLWHLIATFCYVLIVGIDIYYFILVGQKKNKKKIATNRIVAKPWLAHRKKYDQSNPSHKSVINTKN